MQMAGPGCQAAANKLAQGRGYGREGTGRARVARLTTTGALNCRTSPLLLSSAGSTCSCLTAMAYSKTQDLGKPDLIPHASLLPGSCAVHRQRAVQRDGRELAPLLHRPANQFTSPGRGSPSAQRRSQ